MNQLAHIFITYSFLTLFIDQTKKYLIEIIIFSIILDLDHIHWYIKYFKLNKKERKNLNIKQIINLFRTIIQEPIGIIIIELLILILYLIGFNTIIIIIVSLSIFIHWIIDFLTVHTKPLVPFNNKIISLFFHSKKQRIYSEIIITLISFITFLYVFL